MGARKKLRADAMKAERKLVSFAKLNDCPTSPRKMRLVADLVRGVDVDRALSILQFTNKDAAPRLKKLLLSAIANWQAKNEGLRLEDSNVYVKEISVDGAGMLKRLRPAPQGRGYRVRKRSNHVTMILGSRTAASVEVEAAAPTN